MRAADPRTREILERTEALTREQLMRLHGRSATRRSSVGGYWEELERPGPTRCRWTACELRAGSRVRLRPRRRRRLRPRARRADGGGRGDRAGHGGRGPARGRRSRTTPAATSAPSASRATASSSRPTRSSRWATRRRPRDADPRRRHRQRVPRRRRLRRGAGRAGWRAQRAAGRRARSSTSASAAWTSPTRCRTATTRSCSSTPRRAASRRARLRDRARARRGRAGARRARHGPGEVLALARALGGRPPRTLVVGCEPQTRMTADDDEVVAELSEPVRAALDEAVRLVESLVERLDDIDATEGGATMSIAVSAGLPLVAIVGRRARWQLPEIQRYLKVTEDVGGPMHRTKVRDRRGRARRQQHDRARQPRRLRPRTA